MSKTKEDNLTVSERNTNDKDNLVGFFELLLKIDRRTNPELYDRHSDTDNS